MTLSIFTGVPGTGKTAHMVDLLEEQVSNGRIIFSNIAGLKLPHYRLGAVQTWQQGTWLHIDKYIRTSPILKTINRDGSYEYDDISDDDMEANWAPNPDVFLSDNGVLMCRVRDASGQVVGSVKYESHKGALVVVDECQNFFRPRPAGSPVPDHVAAFEVHRKQDLDFWLVTQRLGLIDTNVRGLAGRHVALRSTALGRYKYEWPEVGDIESKASRDNAARTRYRLPKHVFELYKSAESHTKHSHSLPFAAKALFVIFPLVLFLGYRTYSIIHGKFHPDAVTSSVPVASPSKVPVRSFPSHSGASAGSGALASAGGSADGKAANGLPNYLDYRLISACLATASHCQCYTHDGIHLQMSDSDCRNAAASPNDKFRLHVQGFRGRS